MRWVLSSPHRKKQDMGRLLITLPKDTQPQIQAFLSSPTMGTQYSISTSEVSLTLTSRDGPGPSWRLRIKHDIIVLERSRDRHMGIASLIQPLSHFLAVSVFCSCPSRTLSPSSNLHTRPGWPPLTCNSFWSRAAVQSRR